MRIGPTGIGRRVRRVEVSDRPPTALKMELQAAAEGAPVVSVHGDLELESVQAFVRTALDAARRDGRNELVLDLAGVGFVDSRGLQGVIQLGEELRRAGGALVLCSPSRAVRRLLQLAGMDQLVAIALSREQAQGMLAAAGEGSAQ